MEKLSVKEVYLNVARDWRIFTVSMVIALTFGLSAYILSPNEYTSYVDLTIDGVTDSKNSLSGLASIAGISAPDQPGINSGSYDDVAVSTPYLLQVVNKKVFFENDSVTVKDYISQRMVLSFSDKVKNVFKKKSEKIVPGKNNTDDGGIIKAADEENDNSVNILNLDPGDKLAVNVLKTRLIYTADEDKPIHIEVKFQDPNVSAQVAKIVEEQLTHYLKHYQSGKKDNSVEYLQTQLEKVKKKLYSAQMALAAAKDNNRNVIVAAGSVGVDRLTMEYQTASGVYTSLATQLENARIKAQEEKPVFVVIEPPTPLNIKSPSEPRLVIYVALSFVLGLVMALTVIFGKVFVKRNA